MNSTKRGTPALDQAISAVLETWDVLEQQLEDAMAAAPYGSDANEWGYLLAAKYLMRDQIHLMQQQMTTHDRASCTACCDEQRAADIWERAWNHRLLMEATL